MTLQVLTETAIVDGCVRDELHFGKFPSSRAAAASYGRDVKKLIAADFRDTDAIRLQARCAFRWARIALGEPLS